MRRLTAVILLALSFSVMGCIEVIPTFEEGEGGLRVLPGDTRAPMLETGQRWWVVTTYLPETATSDYYTIDAHIPASQIEGATNYAFTDVTTEAGEDGKAIHTTTWEFRVLDSDYWPETRNFFSDPAFRAFDIDPDLRLLLIEAVVSAEEGPSNAAKELNPIFRMMLRADDYRILAAQLEYSEGTVRQTERIDLTGSSNRIGWNIEAEGCVVDLVLPEFPLDNTRDRRMTVSDLEDGSREVAFTSPTDGSLVVQRWEPGSPWFSVSVSDTRISQLIPWQ